MIIAYKVVKLAEGHLCPDIFAHRDEGNSNHIVPTMVPMACPRHRLSPVTVVTDKCAANFPAFINPHSIVRKTEAIVKAPATCKCTTIPQPVFIGLERLREKKNQAECEKLRKGGF
jgi:hypothetical protein